MGGDRLKIFTPNRKDRLSVAEELGLVMRRLICAIDKDATEKYKNI
jgi:hypothetical protein